MIEAEVGVAVDEAEAEGRGELGGDVAVARARHADVDLVEQQDVDVTQHLLLAQVGDDALEVNPPLDVPREHADEVPRRGWRDGLGRRLVIEQVGQVEQLLVVALVDLRAQQLAPPLDPREGIDHLAGEGLRRPVGPIERHRLGLSLLLPLVHQPTPPAAPLGCYRKVDS